jgi:hypothetical protein
MWVRSMTFSRVPTASMQTIIVGSLYVRPTLIAFGLSRRSISTDCERMRPKVGQPTITLDFPKWTLRFWFWHDSQLDYSQDDVSPL